MNDTAFWIEKLSVLLIMGIRIKSIGVWACLLSLVESEQTKFCFWVKEKYNQWGPLKYAPITPDKRLKMTPAQVKGLIPSLGLFLFLVYRSALKYFWFYISTKIEPFLLNNFHHPQVINRQTTSCWSLSGRHPPPGFVRAQFACQRTTTRWTCPQWRGLL